MPKYIKKKDLKRAIDNCTWYHINRNGDLAEGANPADHEPLYKYSDIKKIIKGLPTRKFEDEPTTEDYFTAAPRSCKTCKHDSNKWYELPCVTCWDYGQYESKTEPQTDCARK